MKYRRGGREKDRETFLVPHAGNATKTTEEEMEIKENGGGVHSSMIYLTYCKNFCKCYSVPPTQHNNNNN
jgi:hypothetical protein